ncbi:hypothetical protein HNP84_008277 [Thermocatellispora tengchongensis]|uniref:Uncharacterized protein n=1 Tax=Thermocatellispora tengchongensis TaxID=1073253 RepID=A0A840PKR5_9ACTN|nr:hypothetical protein [Thermocatellispora tengchongensis]MBB5138523.1 hypothetical protein [Thermocatellispora tengchongensis]
MTLMDKVKRYLHTPQGRENIEKAKRMARDPKTQQKARGLFERLRSRSHHR